MKNLAIKIKKNFSGNIKLNEPLAPRTSFKIGGPADLWAEPRSKDDILFLTEFLKENSVDYVLFGNGTNFLVKDSGFRGAVISMKGFSNLVFTQEAVSAGAGVNLSSILTRAARDGLSGFEFSAGIPASVGGAVASNAGGRFGDIRSVLEGATLILNGEPVKAGAEKLCLDYRKSLIENREAVIIEAYFHLSELHPAKIKQRVREITDYRKKTQPCNVKSAGCIFKNPVQMPAGVMISSLGLSGRREGGAEVSVKHANYIINRGRANAADVISLIEMIEQEVFRFYNVKLEREVKIIGA